MIVLCTGNGYRFKDPVSKEGWKIVDLKVAAAIVTFNPSVEDLQVSLANLSRQVSRIVIVDNNSRNINAISTTVCSFDNVLLLKNSQNRGVATALNQIFSWAYGEGFDWVLTLDDDSYVPGNMLKQYQLCLNKASGKIGIVCPLLKNRRDGVVFHSKRSKDECITSGSLTSVVAWKEVGGFDDWLFIDGVDFDFSKRMFRIGYQILECSSVLMMHQIGDSRSIHILGKSPIIWNHSPFRQYYIQRNAIYIDYKLGEYSFSKSLRRFLKDLIFVLIWENDKYEKISAMLSGWRDGMTKIHRMSRK